MTIYAIYKFTNLVNGKVYIGKSMNPEKRKIDHIKAANNDSMFLLPKAIRKYGIDNFSFEVIDTSATNKYEHNVLECYFIREYDCCINDGYDKGYNMTRGGDGWDSDSARRNALIQVKNGTCNFAGTLGEHMRVKHLEDGTRAKAIESCRQKQNIKVQTGTHNRTGDKYSIIVRDRQNDRIASGTHNFAGEVGSNFQLARVKAGSHPFAGDAGTKIQNELIAKGLHYSQVSSKCPHCGKEGKGGGMIKYHFDRCKSKPVI